MKPVAYENVIQSKDHILSLWQAALLPQGTGFPSREASQTRFSAPTDFLLKEESEALFDWLVSDGDPAQARLSLNEICKLKAVQTSSPSEALGFILDLKGILRQVLGQHELSSSHAAELDMLDTRIDQLLLLAFDEYSECREQIMKIKIDELRRLGGKSA